MVKQRHQVKPINPSSPLYLDDRLGPALFALWLVVAVGIASIRWFANEAWQQGKLLPLAGVVALFVSAVVASVMIATTSPRLFRRGLCLAFFLSLLVNLGVVLGLRTVRIEPPVIHLSVTKQPKPVDEPMTLEEFYPLAEDGDDRPQQELRKPVSTGEPNREQRDLIRKTTVRNEEFTRLEIDAATATPIARRPVTVARRQATESAPRQADRQGMLSRQTLQKDSVLGRSQKLDAPSIRPLKQPSVTNPQHFDSQKRSLSSSSRKPTFVEADAESMLQPSLSELARATVASESEQSLRQVPLRPKAANVVPPTASSAEKLPDTERVLERLLDATPVVSGRRPAAISPSMDDPTQVEVPPVIVVIDQPGATRSEIVLPVRRTVNQTLDVPPRRLMTTRIAVPTAIDLDVEEPMSPPSPQPVQTRTVMSAIDERGRTTVERPRLLPSPDERLNRPQPRIPDRESRQANDVARGMVDQISKPVANVVSVDSGTNATQMASSERRLLAADRFRRDVSQQAPVPQADPVPSLPPMAQPEPTPVDLSVASHPRRGQVSSVQTPTFSFSGDDSVATGVPQAIAEPQTRRVKTGEVPDLTSDAVGAANATGRRLMTVTPALPTEVRRPQVQSPETSGQSSAVAASPGVVRQNSESTIARPQVDIQKSSTGLSLVDTQILPRPARANVVQRALPTNRSSSSSAVRQTKRDGEKPMLEDVPLVVLNEGVQTVTQPPEAAIRSSQQSPVVRRSTEADIPIPSEESSEAMPANVINTLKRDIDRRAASMERLGGLEINIDVAEGLGGLASDASIDVGSMRRRTSPESLHVEDTVGRFIRRQVGGELSIRSHDVRPVKAYQTRLNRQGEQPFGGNGRPSPRTEESIELGLVYLTSVQRDDGSWDLNEAGESELSEVDRSPVVIQSDTAATGLCLLAFLGAGYHHRSDKYGLEIQSALQYLIQHQKSDGDLYLPNDDESNKSAWLYSHAIASIALCEAYGMTQDPDLRRPAQLAVDFIVGAQSKRRGGWRYQPGVGSDTSVSGWMVMAMRSAELANLRVPIEVWDHVKNWLDGAQASVENPQFYRYNPFAPNRPTQVHGRRSSLTMTAVGLLMRMYTGWYRDDGPMVAGAHYLSDNLPSMGTPETPQRDTYYWYYATQVMFHMGGEYWQKWNQELHPLLTSTQIQVGNLAGSWDPHHPMPDRWATQAGRLYVTTLNLLSLEVFYRHLPIYEDNSH